MMHPNPRKIIPFLLLAALAAAAWWYLQGAGANAAGGGTQATGTIEATRVTVAAELGGRVEAVLAEEGQAVQAGQALARLNGDVLQAQLAQAEATLGVAQANYDLAAAGAPLEQQRYLVSAAQLELLSARQALQEVQDAAGLNEARLSQEVAAGQKALDLAQQRVNSIEGSRDQSDIDTAQAAVTMAKDRLKKAREDFKPYEKKNVDNVTRAYFLSKLADAQKQYDATVTRLNNTQGEANQIEKDLAAANRALADAQLEDARRRLAALDDGVDPDTAELIQGRIDTAAAHLAAAQAGPTAEQLAVAAAQVEAARAALGVLHAQIERLTIVAPIDGVVLTRTVEPGEVAAPNAALLSLANLDSLSLVIYVPEAIYGTLELGQPVRVSVDSFPGQWFEAEVVHIADQAEFTPRNVQTAEGRRNTVFAIRLSLANPEGKLKPGMPADVDF